MFFSFARIDLESLVLNIEKIQKKVAPATVIPVVKADAYGHGAVMVVRRLAEAGLELFAVARFEEAMELRESGITNPVLIFGRLSEKEIEKAVRHNFRISAFSCSDIDWIEDADIRTPAVIHIKVDTGMGRVGVLPEGFPDLIGRAAASGKIVIEGIYSHFSTSDEADKDFAMQQLERFRHILGQAASMNITPRYVHMANSGAILDLPQSYFSAVRPGIIMYGHYPSQEVQRSIPINQVMSFMTRVAHVRELPPGHAVSYGRRWRSGRKTRVAVLPVGYADGLFRSNTNCGKVLIGGELFPIVGTVTMDQTMIHIKDRPVSVGDEVLIWGRSEQGEIEALEAAQRIGTIPYELTCALSPRVKRIYV